MTMIVDQFYVPQNNDTLASRIMRTKQLIFDNFLNIQCPGTKPTLPAEERNAVSTSQKPSSGSHHPSLYLRLSQVVKSSHCFWDLLHEKCLERNVLCLITPSPTQGHCQKHLKGSKLQKLAKTVTSPWSWNYQKNPFAILQGGEIFVCQIGLKIHIMKLEINMPLKQQD